MTGRTRVGGIYLSIVIHHQVFLGSWESSVS